MTLPYIQHYISTLNNTKSPHYKSTLNPDLPYNRTGLYCKATLLSNIFYWNLVTLVASMDPGMGWWNGEDDESRKRGKEIKMPLRFLSFPLFSSLTSRGFHSHISQGMRRSLDIRSFQQRINIFSNLLIHLTSLLSTLVKWFSSIYLMVILQMLQRTHIHIHIQLQICQKDPL